MSAIPHSMFRVLLSVSCLICFVQSSPTLRADEGTPTLFRAGGGRRIHLWDGECMSGQILDLNQDVLRLRTAWAARLALPRAAVASIEPLPGWRTIFDEDFQNLRLTPEREDQETAAAGLRFAGEPTFADAEDSTTARALMLRADGQSLTCTLKKPLAAGRVGVNFREREQPHGGRWLIELRFAQGKRLRSVKVTIVGSGEDYDVDAGGLEGTLRRVTRTPGWHRLLVQFSNHSLRLTCDEDVLWHNLEAGPGGCLQQVTIRCQRTADRETVRGAVAWTEVSIERAVDEHPQPPAETEQDAVRLLDDDQLFGRIVHADRREVQIEGRFGKRSLPWTAVAGCSFRLPAMLPKAREGAKVRLLVRSGLCAENDVLMGVVRTSDKRRVVLQHALLGEVTLERNQVRELRPLPDRSK